MWIMLNDCFLSIVHKDCARDELLVRARRRGDLEKVFRGVAVVHTPKADYPYRATVKRKAVNSALALELSRVTYENFKDSVQDNRLHNAYLRVWSEMALLSPRRLGGLLSSRDGEDDGEEADTFGLTPAGRRRSPRRAEAG
jgi:hypothetical protein